MSIELLNIDCMEYMATLPDKAFELAIVDPPYGIDRGETFGGKNWKEYEKKDWDKERPTKEYCNELFRVSKNQIVWGANYFTEFLPPSMGWIFWDKGQDLTMSDGELAFTSFDMALRRYTINRCHNGQLGGLLHPTQKPLKLYNRLLRDYAKQGDKILDTHGGSRSLAIACHQMGFDHVSCEIDLDYHNASVKRFAEQTMQQSLFKP
jgi:site-specific DNA-methyltransferase (adenine-specific)